MATRILRMSGFAECERNLRELPKATGKNVLRRIAKGALQPMAQVAAEKAPKRTGKLSYSITVSEQRTRRAKGASKNILINGKWRAEASTGITMAMGPGSGYGTLQYASFDEFGTVDTPAFAYMRAAWSFGSVKALRYIRENLADEILKSVRKRAVKLAKA